jgi:hypothetical protein
MGFFKKAFKSVKKAAKKIGKNVGRVVKDGVALTQYVAQSAIKGVFRLVGLKTPRSRDYGGNEEVMTQMQEFTKESDKVTVNELVTGICFNGTRSNFNFLNPQCYDFDDNFISFTISNSEKYDRDTNEFINLDLSNSFIDPTKKYPIRTIGTKYVGTFSSGLATGGKTCSQVECNIKYDVCNPNTIETSESAITRKVYEYNGTTWVRRDDMSEGVAFHTGVGDDEHAVFWGGLHGSLELANVKMNLPGCDNWKDIINSFQGSFFSEGTSYSTGLSGQESYHLTYSLFSDDVRTNYGVDFTPIVKNINDKNFEIYDESLTEEFDIKKSLEMIEAGNFSSHGGKISYSAYADSDLNSENITVYYPEDTVTIPKELYNFNHESLCNILNGGYNKTFENGVLQTSHTKDSEVVNFALDKDKFNDSISLSITGSDVHNIAESQPLSAYWEIALSNDENVNDEIAWVQYEFVCPTSVESYEITTEILTGGSQVFPESWILVGSDNISASKSEWDRVDIGGLESWSTDISGYSARTFKVETPKPYKFYRIYFQKLTNESVRINQLKYFAYRHPSVWLWCPPYSQSGLQHIKDSEGFYIQSSSLVTSGDNAEVVRSIRKSGGGARVTRAVMAGSNSTGIGNLDYGKCMASCSGKPFDFGNSKLDIDANIPTDEEMISSFPWNVIGDNGILGCTGFTEMIDSNKNYWVAFGDSSNKNASQFKDSDFINTYTIIKVPFNKLKEFEETILAYDNYRYANIQVRDFQRKDWSEVAINPKFGTYVTEVRASRNREGFLEMLNSRIGEKFFELYIKILDYNTTNPANNSYVYNEINSVDASAGVYNLGELDFSYTNEYYPIVGIDLVSKNDINCGCDFCNTENALTVDSSGNPVSFEVNMAPKWKQHNHTEWATSYLESPFSGPFSRENFNIWLSAGQDAGWGTVLWSTVDKGESWMHMRKSRFSISGENLVFATLTATFNMNTFSGSYTTIPMYINYDEFIFDVNYYKPLLEVQKILSRESKEIVCDDTLLTYTNPNIFLFCSEPKEIDLGAIFSDEPVTNRSLGNADSIEIDDTADISGGVGFHSQSPFKLQPTDDIIVYSGSINGVPLIISGELTIVKGDSIAYPSYPFDSSDVVYTNSGQFSISEYGINTDSISAVPLEENENEFDEQIGSVEGVDEKITVGQRLILNRYRSSFGLSRSKLQRKYPWLDTYLNQNSPIYADSISRLSDRQRTILDKYLNSNGISKLKLRKKHPWLGNIKIPPITSSGFNQTLRRNKRGIKNIWISARRRNIKDRKQEVLLPSENPDITSYSPAIIPSGQELFVAEKGVTYWFFFGIPDNSPDNSFNIYVKGKMNYIPKFTDIKVDTDPDLGYTEWVTSFIMEYKKRETFKDGSELKYYYKYNVMDMESDTLNPKEEVNNTNKNIIGTDWRRFQDGVGLGGYASPIINNRYPSNVKCTTQSGIAIGSVAFGDTNQAIICGGYKNNSDGILSPTRSWWGLLTDTPTYKWNRYVINPEDALNSNYRKRNFSPFFSDGSQTYTDSIHSCIIFDTSKPQSFDRHGQVIFNNETAKQVNFEDFPEYTEEKDKYSISLQPTNNVKVWWSDKKENTFTINSEINWTGTVDWKIFKVTDIPLEQIEKMDGEDTFEIYEDK